MKNKVKVILGQATLVSFLILVVISVEGIWVHAVGNDITFPWYLPVSVVAVSFLTGVPTLLLSVNPTSKLKWIALIVAHYILVIAIVLFCGYLFHWYSNSLGFFFILAVCSVIYVIVWVVMTLMSKHDAKVINSALGNIRDDE